MFCKLMKLRKKSVVYLLYFQVSSKRPLSLFFFFFPENFPIFYLMLKSGKSFAKIGSRLQMAFFFLFYRNFQTPLPPSRLFVWFYLMFQLPPPPHTNSQMPPYGPILYRVFWNLQNHKENILFPKNHYFERCTRPGYGRRVIVVARACTHHIKNTSTWNSHA